GKNGKVRRSLGFARAFARGCFRATERCRRTDEIGCERLHHLDKLGVTGSSPVPPIRKALLRGFFVARKGDRWRDRAKVRPANCFRRAPYPPRSLRAKPSARLTFGSCAAVEPQLCRLGVIHRSPSSLPSRRFLHGIDDRCDLARVEEAGRG